MIILTHAMRFATQAANRLIFRDGGRIIETGEPGRLRESRSTERLQNFLNRVI